MTELRRVLLSPRRLALLLVLLLLCAWEVAPPNRWQRAREYRTAQETHLAGYEGMSLEEIMAEINEATDGGSYRTGQYSALYDKVKYQLEFEESLAAIQSKAKNMSTVSIFAGSPYSQANIKKTARDFARLEGTTLTLGLDRPVEAVMDNKTSDWLLGVWMLIVVLSFLAERQRGLWNVVCSSARGRVALPLWRLMTLILAAVLGTVLMTLGELAVSYGIHGGLDQLGRMVQSVPQFFSLTTPMTIGEFWLYYMVLRSLGMLTVGLVIWLLFELISDRRMAALALTLILGAEYLLSSGVASQKFLGVVNLVTFLQPRHLVLNYSNVAVLGKPVGQLPLTLWSGLILSLLSIGLIFLRYRKRKPVGSYAWLDRLAELWLRLTAPLGYHTRLLGHMLHQILSVGRGGIILLVALVVGFSLAEPAPLGSSDTQATLYESYLRQSQGPVTEDTWAFLEKLETRLSEDQNRYAQLREQLAAGEIDQATYEDQVFPYRELSARAGAVAQYRAHVEAVSTLEDPHILPQWVYQSFFGITDSQPRLLFGLCLAAALLLFAFQAGAQNRSGIVKSQKATLHGRGKLELYRHLGAWFVTFLFCWLVWMMQLWRLWRSYGDGLPFFGAPVQCLTFWQDMTANRSVALQWVLLCLKHTLLTCAWSSGILLVTGGLQRKR